jgi:arylsulfatase
MSDRKKPNIILLMTDQQRIDTVHSFGYDHMITPNLDNLSRRGIRFTNNFACGATCIASRAAMFTGMYPHNTGVYSFNPWAHHRSWVHDLADVGYHCVNIGKMHIDPKYDAYAFHERVVVENPSRPTTAWGEVDDEWGKFLSLYGHERIGSRHKTDPEWGKKYQAEAWHLDEQFHPDVFIGSQALGWIFRHKPEKPVFLQIGFTGPHEPYDPLSRHLELYRDKEVPTPYLKENELDEKPIQQRAHQDFNARFDHECRIDMEHASSEDIVRMRRHYYANVTTIDEKIGEVLDALEKHGYLDNAVVIFTSDHGDMLGEHQLTYKWFMYDSCVHVPLIIWDTTKEDTPAIVDELVSHIDIGPTILEAAQVSAPQWLEGCSLWNSIKEEQQGERYVFCEDNYLTMIRGKKYKLVYYTFQEDDGELYDVENDPHELTNLFHHSKYQEIKRELEKKMFHWLIRSNYRTMGYKNHQLDTPLHFPQKNPYLHMAVEQRSDIWAIPEPSPKLKERLRKNYQYGNGRFEKREEN